MSLQNKYVQIIFVLLIAAIIQIVEGFPTTYNTDSYVARCYDKLETALDTMLKMNQKRMSRGETIMPNYPTSNVEVRNLRVRLPPGPANLQHPQMKWYKIDKCQFMNANRTLSTKLIFPDLQISGQVMINPNGDYCNMILRLRHAVIEFITVPLLPQGDDNEEHLDNGRYKINMKKIEQTIRTDSHFVEPGFISVFAHGCNHVPNSIRASISPASSPLLYIDNLDSNRIIDDDKALDNLDEIFSSGVRSLLTTYMQRHLQPAIKETLMESMGFKLSYG